jgi:hypothetical protein
MHIGSVTLETIRTADPIVHDTNPSVVEMVFAMLKRYKSPGSDHIPVQLTQATGEILRCEIH